jgi:hypothetical protein
MTVTWNNRPPLIDYLADFRSTADNVWMTFSSPELDAHVDSCVNARIPVRFASRCSLWLFPGTLTWYYHSKETGPSFAPELTYGGNTYTVSQDARVDAQNPNTNYGIDYLWNCDNDLDWRQVTYFEFPVPAGVQESSKSTTAFKSFPNPFYHSTSISYCVLSGEAAKEVALSVYDVSGNLIKRLTDGIESPGKHTVLWSGENTHGNEAPAGIYLLKLTIGERTVSSKVMRLH